MTAPHWDWEAKARYIIAIARGRRTDSATDEIVDNLKAAYTAGADAERARVFAMMRTDIKTATGLDWSPIDGRPLTWVFEQYRATAPTPNP